MVFGDENIFRLDVAVQQLALVNIFQAFEQGDENTGQLVFTRAGMFFNPLVQGDAAQIGHHEISSAVGLEQVGYLDYVGVV